jgi:four helix bundle protein
LAEGSGRKTLKDRCRFYTMAMGSVREVQAVLDLAALDTSFCLEIDLIAAHVFKLIRSSQ